MKRLLIVALLVVSTGASAQITTQMTPITIDPNAFANGYNQAQAIMGNDSRLPVVPDHRYEDQQRQYQQQMLQLQQQQLEQIEQMRRQYRY